MALGEMLLWPKIARLSNETMIVTEKIDGSSGCLFFDDEGSMHVQSRNRVLSVENDNFGFCAWAVANHETLFADLGPGYAFGEWWGAGIQRRYDLDHKRFSLFNVHRWDAARGHFQTPNLDVVPLLHTGPLEPDDIYAWDAELRATGSRAVPGYMSPEGVVAYLQQAKVSYKVTDAKAGPEKHA